MRPRSPDRLSACVRRNARAEHERRSRARSRNLAERRAPRRLSVRVRTTQLQTPSSRFYVKMTKAPRHGPAQLLVVASTRWQSADTLGALMRPRPCAKGAKRSKRAYGLAKRRTEHNQGGRLAVHALRNLAPHPAMLRANRNTLPTALCAGTPLELERHPRPVSKASRSAATARGVLSHPCQVRQIPALNCRAHSHRVPSCDRRRGGSWIFGERSPGSGSLRGGSSRGGSSGSGSPAGSGGLPGSRIGGGSASGLPGSGRRLLIAMSSPPRGRSTRPANCARAFLDCISRTLACVILQTFPASSRSEQFALASSSARSSSSQLLARRIAASCRRMPRATSSTAVRLSKTMPRNVQYRMRASAAKC